MLNEEQFLKGMAVLMSAYPDYKCTADTVDIYRVALRSLSPQEFEKAVWAHITTFKWFPKISEILQAVRDLNPPPSPIDAWNRLMAAAEGSGGPPEMDAAIEKAVSFVGGWDALCYTPFDQHRFMFARFKEAYQEAREQERVQEQIGHQSVPQLEG